MIYLQAFEILYQRTFIELQPLTCWVEAQHGLPVNELLAAAIGR